MSLSSCAKILAKINTAGVINVTVNGSGKEEEKEYDKEKENEKEKKGCKRNFN